MQVKTYYLNWDRGTQNACTLLHYFMLGYEENQEMPNYELYRQHTVELQDEMTPQDIFGYFNCDNRPDGQVERSMCVGDLIEFPNGQIYGVNPLGFVRLKAI